MELMYATPQEINMLETRLLFVLQQCVWGVATAVFAWALAGTSRALVCLSVEDVPVVVEPVHLAGSPGMSEACSIVVSDDPRR
jgi:hypothetical protein